MAQIVFLKDGATSHSTKSIFYFVKRSGLYRGAFFVLILILCSFAFFFNSAFLPVIFFLLLYFYSIKQRVELIWHFYLS
jgi:hypothetical protein